MARGIHPVVYGAAGVLAIGLLAVGSRRATPVAASAATANTCPPRTLPDEDACVPLPDDTRPRVAEPTGKNETFRIALRSGYSSDSRAYRFPLDESKKGLIFLRGFEEHSEDGGIVLFANPGEDVHFVALDRQEGPASALFVGDLFEGTVVTQHRTVDNGSFRTILTIYGRLGTIEPGIVRGKLLEDREAIAKVGSKSELHFAARVVREGVDPEKEDIRTLVSSASTEIDLRNVLPPRAQR